jgi:hypothetical protein
MLWDCPGASSDNCDEESNCRNHALTLLPPHVKKMTIIQVIVVAAMLSLEDGQIGATFANHLDQSQAFQGNLSHLNHR